MGQKDDWIIKQFDNTEDKDKNYGKYQLNFYTVYNSIKLQRKENTIQYNIIQHQMKNSKNKNMI